MTFNATDPQNHKGKSDSWLTPLWIIEALGNDFDLDPCGFKHHRTAKMIYQAPLDDGLVEPWFGKVWLNPPYSDLEKWLNKLHVHGNGVALLFNRMDTKWMQKHFKLADEVFFLRGRVRFLTPELQEKTNAGTGSVLFSYGLKNDYSKLEGVRVK